MKAQTRTLLSLCLAVVLVLTAVLGTIAYMTASDTKTNTFTVGSFSQPTTDPENPGTSLDVDGYIYEKSWVNNSKLVPGSSIAKDPRVGIGAGSEDAWVYVYIKNNLVTASGNEVTFKLNDGWEPVDATEVTSGSRVYTGGLFKYSTKLNAANADDWTTTIFDTVEVASTATVEGFEKATEKTMVVNAYIHQANDGDTTIPDTTINDAAKAWVANLGT